MNAVKWIDRHLEEILLVVLLFVMMLIMGIQIVARYALGNSLSWSEEITRFCFIWTGFLSISYCVKNGKSIKIEQFVEWFRDDWNGMGVHLFRVCSYLIELVLFAYLLPFAVHFVQESRQGHAASPAVGIPMWIVQSITVISFALCEVRLLQKLVERIMLIRNGRREEETGAGLQAGTAGEAAGAGLQAEEETEDSKKKSASGLQGSIAITQTEAPEKGGEK